MAVDKAYPDSEDAESVGPEQLASPADQALLQRAATSCIVPIRSLGQGAFAHVDLVSMPVGSARKLLVRKVLVTSNSSAANNTQAQAPSQLPLLAPIKPSSQQDWSREAAMHREAAGCPFVLQLLAAKRCRSGNLLLLLEYATQGTLTDMMAARQRQQAATATAAAVDALLPLALSAAELLLDEEDELGAAAGTPEEQQQQHSDAEPVFITLLPNALPATVCPNTAAAAAVASLSVAGTANINLSSDGTLDQVLGHTAAQATAATAAPAAVSALNQLPALPAGLPEDAAKFYSACIVLALQWLHSRRILHRDVKPCNLLLFCDGYLKLADLGCCCQLPPGVSSAHTRTGTSSYMAPEVQGGATPYSYPVDLWSLGVTIWQMVAGCLPAWAQEQQEQQGQGTQAQQQQQQQQQQQVLPPSPEPLVFPAQFSKELRCLLCGLLCRDSSQRLSIDQVVASSWFEGFDWQALTDKTLTPPALA